MLDWPYFWQILTVGGFALVAELVFLIWAMRCRGPEGRAANAPKRKSAHWPLLLSSVVVLVMPILVVALANAGRSDLMQETVGTQGPRWALMTREPNQQRVLLLGTTLALPSFLLAGITAGVIATPRRAGRVRRLFFCSAVPAIFLPFLSGVLLYLHRLLTMKCSGPDGFTARGRAPVVSSTLSAAKHALDSGVVTAGVVLAIVIVGLTLQVVRQKEEGAQDWPTPARATVLGLFLLTIAASLCWLSGPLAAENRALLPDHSGHTTERIFPAVPAGTSQEGLYDLSYRARMGIYRNRLPFPLSSQEQDAIALWGPVVEVTDHGVMMDWRKLSRRQELRESVQSAQMNHRLLHGDAGAGSTLIMATPNAPLDLLADVLAVIHDLGSCEVRLVTGWPQTVQRPTVGALTRIVWQATAVALRRDGDIDPEKTWRSIRVPGSLQRYRSMLDQILKARAASPPPVLLLDAEPSPHWGGWEE